MTTADETPPMPIPATVNVHPALAPALARQGYATLTPVQTAVLEDKADGQRPAGLRPDRLGQDRGLRPRHCPDPAGRHEHRRARGAPAGADHRADARTGPAGRARAALALCRGRRRSRRPAWAAWTCARRAAQLDRGAHIVVGTPGRLRDHITKGSLDLSELRAVVLDEADEMLDMGFREDLEFILAAAPDRAPHADVLGHRAEADRPARQDLPARRAAHRRHRRAASGTPTSTTSWCWSQPHERENAIINTLRFYDSGSAIVFCHTREAVKHLAAQLGDRGFHVVSLSGELSQSERTNALQSMRDGRSRVCVATDVAARGIDLPNLDLVIHADLPTNPDTLLHRSGRTGRAGRKGVCVLIVPVRRYSAATRVLGFANAQGTVRSAPDRRRHRGALPRADPRGRDHPQPCRRRPRPPSWPNC